MRANGRVAVFVLLGLIWGSEWLATQSMETPPLQSLTLRYALAFLILAAAAAVLRLQLPSIRDVVAMAITGVVLLALPAMLTLWAAGSVSPGLLVVVLAATPLIAALLEARASGRLLTLLISGLAGTILIAAQGLSFAATQWKGAAAALTAATLIAGSIVYVKRALSRMHPMVLAATQFGAASIALAAASLLVEGHSLPVWTRGEAARQMAAALLANALAFPLYYWLLRRVESFQLTASQWLVTVAGVVEALILEREFPPWRILAGIAVVLLSISALWKRRSGDDEEVTIQLTSPASKG